MPTLSTSYLVVGSGLTGSVIARALADAGRDVLVLDRRTHAGGNVHDHTHSCGIRIHTYGPHYFRTSSDRVWDFATRFAPFYRYEAVVQSAIDTELAQWPVTTNYINRQVGLNWAPAFKGIPSNFEEAALALMPRQIYEQFVQQYNEKQWGVPARALPADLCRRFDVRRDDDPRLKPGAKYQGIPKPGYAAWMRQLLDGIPVLLNVDYLQRRDEFRASKWLIFTGPIDEYFGFDLGRLKYRGQRRSHTYLPDIRYAQPCGQVNNPLHAGGPHIRTLEWKHMMDRQDADRISGTVLTQEVPCTPNHPTDYEYPFPGDANSAAYRAYRERAEVLENVLICGRLGEYRYYDMDQAIARAMALAHRILHGRQAARPAQKLGDG